MEEHGLGKKTPFILSLSIVDMNMVLVFLKSLKHFGTDSSSEKARCLAFRTSIVHCNERNVFVNFKKLRGHDFLTKKKCITFL